MSSTAKTPAQSAKPFDAAKYQTDKDAKAAKTGPSPASTNKAASTTAPSTAGTGGYDPAKAIEALTIKTKAVYVPPHPIPSPRGQTDDKCWGPRQQRQQRRPRRQQPTRLQRGKAARPRVAQDGQTA